MKRHIFSLVGISICLLTLAPLNPAPATAEQPTSFDEVIDIEIVNLDVYVTDKKGRPITGLSREDFTLFANDQSVEITNFSAIEDGQQGVNNLEIQEESASLSPVETKQAGTEPLFLVVYIDNVHLGQFTRNRLLDELRPFLKQRHHDGNQVMLVTYDGRVRAEQAFTSDWSQLAAAIERLKQGQSLGHLTEIAHQRVIEDMLLRSDTQRYLAANSNLPLPSTKCPAEMGEMAKRHAQDIRRQVEGSVNNLTAFVDTLATLPGRKALLHVSDGLPLNPGAEVFEFLFQFCDAAGAESTEYNQAEAGQLDTDNPGGVSPAVQALIEASADEPTLGNAYHGQQAQLDAAQFNSGKLFEQLTTKANASRVTFFTFEAYGPRNFSVSSAAVGQRRSTSRRSDEVRRSSLQDSLSTMAERTGGLAILDTTQFTPAIEKVGQDFDNYYSLGYNLAQAAQDRTVQVRVEVNRKAARLRYRKSLQSRSQADNLAGRTHAALLYGLVDNPLGITVAMGAALPMDDGMHLVPVQVRIPIGKLALVPDEGIHQAQLTLMLSGRDTDGATSPVRSVKVPIRVPADQLETARARLYVYEVKMLMRSGQHTMAVGVHDDIASVASFITEDLAVASGAMPAALVDGQ